MGLIDAIIEGDFVAGALQLRARTAGAAARARAAPPSAVSMRSVINAEFTAQWQAEARRLYPNRTAALTALDAVKASARLSFAEGLLYEEKLANQTKVTVEARGAIHVFFAERESRKVDGLPGGHRATSDRQRRSRRRRHHGRRHRDRLRERRYSGDACST